MYVDRHSVELLLKYSADPEPDEFELRKWLDVLVDRASVESREEFAAVVSEGDYPINAVRPQSAPEGEVSISIDRAPPAMLLILGEAVDPDITDLRNEVPQELEASLMAALATWNRPKLQGMLDEPGWKVPEPPDQPDDTQPPKEPDQSTEQEPDQDAENPPAEPDMVDGSDVPDEEPEDELASRKKLIMGVGAVAAIGLGFWMWKRRRTEP